MTTPMIDDDDDDDHDVFMYLESTVSLGSFLPKETLEPALEFFPPRIERLVENHVVRVSFNCCGEVWTTRARPLIVRPTPGDGRIVNIVGDPEIELTASEQLSDNETTSTFQVKGLFLGRTFLKVSYRTVTNSYGNATDWTGPAPGSWQELPVRYRVSVIRADGVMNKVFLAMVAILVICVNIGMGCKVDMTVVKEVMRRPSSPVIGFFCQFLFMPLVAFSLVKIIGLRGGVALGLFASGCAPGGGASNMYTYMLGGDVSLSITMTLISVFASLGMIPLWLYTLGRHLLDSDNEDESSISIPFTNIIITLFSLLIPVVVGLLIQRHRPRVASIIVTWLKPVFVFFIVFMVTFGVYTNLYIFSLLTPRVLFAGCLMPYVGFVCGGLLACVTRQPRARMIAIAIETGIQNTGIPIVLMKYSLPQPEADLSVVAPVVVAMFTPIPLWIAMVALEVRRRCCSDGGDKKKAIEAMELSEDLLMDSTTRPNGDQPKHNGVAVTTQSQLTAPA
ncbi:P3 protein [Lamellibrachia satsuma]|nr:P3 protein [Lamellibrachia satsuma]